MAIWAWVLVGAVAFTCFGAALLFAREEGRRSFVISLIVSTAITALSFAVLFWWCNSTEAGRRAMKSQESNLNGGLYRTVTVYGYSGDEIRSWSGKFDVTENDQETWFDIGGRRVIIQGGIIINEEGEN